MTSGGKMWGSRGQSFWGVRCRGRRWGALLYFECWLCNTISILKTFKIIMTENKIYKFKDHFLTIYSEYFNIYFLFQGVDLKKEPCPIF